jgi:hypothetical protein
VLYPLPLPFLSGIKEAKESLTGILAYFGKVTANQDEEEYMTQNVIDLIVFVSKIVAVFDY